jgi:hypothetical protein
MARVRKMYSFSFPGQRVIYLFHFKHPKGFWEHDIDSGRFFGFG